MFVREKTKPRVAVGQQYEEVVEFPNLIEIQLASYERFLQLNAIQNGEELRRQGLQEVFKSTFPIESPNGDFLLEFHHYHIELDGIRPEAECKQKSLTYEAPLKARISLVFANSGEIRQKDIYMGDIPLMTERGTFIINGAERVVVSQIHRSPGVIFSFEKGVYSSRIIPYRGSWLEFEIDQKKDLIYVKIDRKKRILATLLLRAIGFDSREKIIDLFYKLEQVVIENNDNCREKLVGRVLGRAVFIKDEEGNDKKLLRAGDTLYSHEIDTLIHNAISEVNIIDLAAEGSLNSNIILNCFEREDGKGITGSAESDEPTKEDGLVAIFSVLTPGDPVSAESAEKELLNMFFTSRRYDLGDVGRYKLNKKLRLADAPDPRENPTLTREDIAATMAYLIRVYIGEETVDDIDHLGNRRIRSVGELLTNSMKNAFSRMDRIVRERMSLKEVESLKPQDIVSIKPIVSAIKEFFGSSQLSQFMDQCNPLSELTHKRRLNALGPGGLSRDRASFEVRDVHYTHYGRMCPIETPEGPNIGLIVSLANYARVNEYGFLESPYRKVIKGMASKEVEYLSAIDEERYFIAQASSPIDSNGKFLEEQIAVRKSGDYNTRKAEDVKYMDVSPKQIISTAASLIPFLEHDDANRALMGCNMQRQAVPLLFPEAPIVGTGMESKAAYDSGVMVKARRDGVVNYVSSHKITIKPHQAKDDNDIDNYYLIKFQRTNQDTCFNQVPIVKTGEEVKAGDIIADGPATQNGELALGRNLLVGFVPWKGYNFEDAVLISEKVVKDDYYTSVHINEFQLEVRETKLGVEKLTNDIPNTSEKAVEQLDEEGIIRVGAFVKANTILVGKVTPKSETETTPEFKLLNSIFGEKAKEVRDSSLRVPHGTEGVVVDVQRLKRANDDELNAGVEEVVKVLVATKRKLRVGDKMAGRHGNKGVVARIIPEEDMPYLEDGTPLDVCLNPLGVPSRMNIGQVLETELGLVGAKKGVHFSSPVFQSPSNDEIQEMLAEVGVDRSCKATLYDGLTGEAFKNKVFVGYMYYLKLHHLVDDKMHARSTGPYSLVTQQPLGGKAQFGGQRLGEMEVWALEAYGAANTLQELLTVKSDDMNGRTKMYEAIVKGDPVNPAGIPEAFNVMLQELRGLALDLSLSDTKGRPVPLTERDAEIFSKKQEP
ncbi:MAG: DNA-directed RNA polymerase subunit beta [Spirochaetaceae bacterium]|nr:DNA-directed RNA polymerase subunit beta [Spirochaetaceae bacterium]